MLTPLAAIPLMVLAAQSPPTQAPPPVRPAQVVRAPAAPAKIYNETADAKALLVRALAMADEDDIRVLINWGSNSCARCTALPEALRAPDVRALNYTNEYRTVNVDVGNLDRNLDLARTYGVTLTAAALPALTVLDEHGKVLAQATAPDFLSAPAAPTFDTKKIAAFLTKHQAPHPDAIAPFEAAVKQAKASNKTVFVWFSAPW